MLILHSSKVSNKKRERIEILLARHCDTHHKIIQNYSYPNINKQIDSQLLFQNGIFDFYINFLTDLEKRHRMTQILKDTH